MIIPEALRQERDYQRCVDFHGHTCMGLTLGYLAAQLALSRLRETRAEDEELICITETDACCCDAIQILTGCTFGKGNLLYRDLGKMAFTFASRTTGQGIRISMKPGVMDRPPREEHLATLIREGKASRGEQNEYERLLQTRSEALFRQGATGFFQVSETAIELPSTARIAPSKICDGCREPVMITKMAEIAGCQLCRDCAQAASRK